MAWCKNEQPYSDEQGERGITAQLALKTITHTKIIAFLYLKFLN